MKKLLIILFICFNLIGYSQTKRALFIGNSYTAYYNMPQLVANMASTVGDNLIFSTSTVDGTSLFAHSTNTTTLNLIMQGGWDYVTLQEQSQNPSYSLSWVQSNVFPYATFLDSRINTYNPGAETIFYMTWGRKNGDAERCPTVPEVCTYVGMDDLTRERYMMMASDNHAIVSPVGAVWRYIRENYPSIELYDPDGSHPSPAGSFASACCFYTAIFRKDPTLLTYNYSLSSTDADRIRAVVKTVVFNNLLTWHIGEYDPDTQAPTTPTNLHSDNITETGFRLSWTASTDNIAVTGYNIFQNGSLITTSTSTSADITGLNVSTTYSYTVRARDAAGNISAASNILNVSTGDTHPPTTPTGLSASIINVTSVTLTWLASTDNVGVSEYEVYKDGVLASTISGTSVILTGLNSSTIYQVTVRAKDAAGNVSAYSNSLSVTTNFAIIVLTVSGVGANNKVYDGRTTATLITGSAALEGVIPGDNVTLITTGATGTFVSKNVGTSRTISTTGFSLGGTDAFKYSLSQPTTSANITTANLTVTGVTANNKVYNGSASATLNTGIGSLSGVFSGDVVTLISSGASGVFSNKNTGTSKTVTTSGFTLGGDDAANYTFSQPVLTANITPAPLTVTGVTARNKTYDGSTDASVNYGSASLNGIIGSENVTLVSSGVDGTFSNKNVGPSKTVTLSGFSITGSDAGNYTLTQPVTTANITGLSLNITGVTANNKVYNGNLSASLNTGSANLSGTIISGDAVSLVRSGATGTFSTKNVGSNKTVYSSGFTLSGSDAGNYFIIQPSVSASITTATMTISGITINNKVYDGTTSATLNTGSATLTGLYSEDLVTINSSGASASFNNENVGNSKTVNISGFALAGADAINYTLTQPTATGNITAASLTVTGITANNRPYDRTTTAVLNTGGAALSGVISGDIVNLSTSGATGSFSNKNAGTAKTITTTGFAISGADIANYTLIQPSTTANITAIGITVTGITANNKTYNGNTVATLSSGSAILSGILTGDIVTLISAGATGTFERETIGTGITVTTSGFVLGGADGGNYTMTQPITSANITVATLTVTGVTANNKVYDGSASAALNLSRATLVGIFGSDDVTLFTTNAIGTFSNKNAGNNKPVTINGLSLLGTDANNYTLTQPATVANITAKNITVTANHLVKSYKNILTFTGDEYTVAGFIPEDVLPLLSLSSPGASESAAVGDYVITISGSAGSNYIIHFVNGVLTVGKAEITVKVDDKTKVYGEPNPDFTISYSGFPKGEDLQYVDVLPVIETNADASSDAGAYAIVASGAQDANYTFTYYDGTLTITKAQQQIQFEDMPTGLRMTQECELVASSSSGLPITFEISDPNKASLNGNVLTILEDGKIEVIAKQEGNHNYQAASDVVKTIETLPTFDHISSLFTPNADGMNDYWYIPDLENYGTIKVNVYNRFGQLVYKSDSYENDWNGTWNGNPLPSAAYYYIIKSSLKGSIKGVVNIVR